MLDTHIPLAPLSSDKGLKILAPYFQNKVLESHPIEGTRIFTEEEEEADTECLLSLSIHYINKHFEFWKIAFSVDLGVYPSEDDIATADLKRIQTVQVGSS